VQKLLPRYGISSQICIKPCAPITNTNEVQKKMGGPLYQSLSMMLHIHSPETVSLRVTAQCTPPPLTLRSTKRILWQRCHAFERSIQRPTAATQSMWRHIRAAAKDGESDAGPRKPWIRARDSRAQKRGRVSGSM
jgi:hypothetical protein